jgi:PHD/YefM family antitoxin component YafN of YafNO toxin-antitoxin module
VQKFKSDYAEFRKEFERIKEEVSENSAQVLITNEKKEHLHTASLCQLDSTQRPNAPSSSPQAQARLSPQTPGDASLHHTQSHPPLLHT